MNWQKIVGLWLLLAALPAGSAMPDTPTGSDKPSNIEPAQGRQIIVQTLPRIPPSSRLARRRSTRKSGLARVGKAI